MLYHLPGRSDIGGYCSASYTAAHLLSYRKDMYFPSSDVRCGLSAEVFRQIWQLGMRTDLLSMLRNTAACLFAFGPNGLRESSVVSLPTTDVAISSSRMSV